MNKMRLLQISLAVLVLTTAAFAAREAVARAGSAEAVDLSFHTPPMSDYRPNDNVFHTPPMSDYRRDDNVFHTPPMSDYLREDNEFHTPPMSDYNR